MQLKDWRVIWVDGDPLLAHVEDLANMSVGGSVRTLTIDSANRLEVWVSGDRSMTKVPMGTAALAIEGLGRWISGSRRSYVCLTH